MIFALPESNNEQFNRKIGDVFEQLSEKPTVEATQLGEVNPLTPISQPQLK